MIQIPFSLDKDLGKAYNQAMARVTEEYSILMDYDAMILSPGTLPLVDKYVKQFPAALLTGYGSRAHNSSAQKYMYQNRGNIIEAMRIAEKLERKPMSVRKIEKNLTGFFMVIKKSTWDKYKFTEGIGCMGVDTDYWQQLIKGGETILLMETVYVWHTYRIRNGIGDKRHLFKV